MSAIRHLRWATFLPETVCPQPRYMDALRQSNMGAPPPPDTTIRAESLRSPEEAEAARTAVPDVEWLRNRVIVLIGDSFDRNLVTSVCDAVTGDLHVVSPFCKDNHANTTFPSPFRGGLPLHCRIESLNAHIVAVFVLGVATVHMEVITRHIDPMAEWADNAKLLDPRDRLVQVSHLLQANQLEPDAVIMTSIHWDLLQRYMDYARDHNLSPSNHPFTTEWVTDSWMPRVRQAIIQTAQSVFSSASYFAWRTAPPVLESLVHTKKGVYFSSPTIPQEYRNFDNDKAEILNAAGRRLAIEEGMDVVDFARYMAAQQRFLFGDGYHWSRHMNLKMFELLLAQVHNRFDARS